MRSKNPKAPFRLAIVSSIVLAICGLSTPVMGQQKALDEILVFAERFCGQYWREGEDSGLELTGEAEVDLGKFIKNLFNLGFSGGVQFNSSEYIGVLREHLAPEFKHVRDCRLTLWSDLKILAIPVQPGGQSDGANPVKLEFQGSDRVVELSGDILTYGDRFEIEADTVVANNATIKVARNKPNRASNGSHGAHGANGAANSGSKGGRGGDGTAGSDGEDAIDIGGVTIQARVFSGTLRVDVSGLPGQDGGDGGNGGNGGIGGSGRNGASSLFDCKRGPGSGGNGGDAGRGGDAGNGGDGGSAGDVTIEAKKIRSGSRIAVIGRGGRGGESGRPGEAGNPGQGGPRGSAPGLCRSGGASRGSSGTGNHAGLSGRSGRDGADGLIRIIVGTKEIQGHGKYEFVQ